MILSSSKTKLSQSLFETTGIKYHVEDVFDIAILFFDSIFEIKARLSMFQKS
jgi:hypothetical protein